MKTAKQNLGRALTILLRAPMREAAICEDLAAFHAPSECYRDAFRGEAQRVRLEQRLACRVAGVRNMHLLRRAMRAALGNDAWVYRYYGVVPY